MNLKHRSGGAVDTRVTGDWFQQATSIDAFARLIERGRMNYFKAGLAVGQSRFLVEDPLRDGRGRCARALSREKILGQAWRPVRDRLPWARCVLRCEDWGVRTGSSL